MNQNEIEELRAKYDRRLDEFGYSPRTLGWNKPKARLRFAILLEYWADANATSLLDFGCGFGDLSAMLGERYSGVEYHGIDLNPKLIEVGKRVYPKAELQAGNPLADGLSRNYDIIVASGAHNHAISDNDTYVRRTFDLFNKHATIGFAINFLSDRVNFKRPENYYANAPEMLRLALEYSPRVVLRHDYMPFEFSIFVDKRNSIVEPVNVFESFTGQLDP